MNSSTKATKMLIALCGRKLLKNCPELHILMVKRLIEVKDQLKVVLEEQSWDDLATSGNLLIEIYQPGKYYSKYS